MLEYAKVKTYPIPPTQYLLGFQLRNREEEEEEEKEEKEEKKEEEEEKEEGQEQEENI